MENKSLNEALKQYFGFSELRLSQIPVINNVLAGNDTLAIMPTGGGKSLCYQLPAMLFPGITVVISPLIALMHDQVQSLSKNGIFAGYLNSSQNIIEQNKIIQALENHNNPEVIKNEDKLKVLYISPEKLLANNCEFLNYLSHLPISLIAIDEAHCVSSWGHDFRPEYSNLGVIKEKFTNTPIIALTATADELTRIDIVQKLNLQNGQTFISSFDRPNIHYKVEPIGDQFTQLTDFINTQKNQAGIVYCLSRKSTEELSKKLNKIGINSMPYHASISKEEKEKAYNYFMQDKIQVIVATIAFGMGIDKPNVRFVVHWNLPKNIESYYQETGRAGRDGFDSVALLIYNPGDAFTLRKFIDSSTTNGVDNETYKSIQSNKLDRLLEFCQTGHCRRRILLQYFQEKITQDCNNCDCCDFPRDKIDGNIITQKVISAIYRTNQKFGIGYIVDLILGITNERNKKYKHTELPTFGIGKDLEKDAWMYYINQLIDLGIVNIKFEQHIKTLELAAGYKEIITGEKIVKLIKYKTKEEKVKVKTKKTKIAINETEKDLFDKLKALRKQIANDENVPAFVIFSDQTLLYFSNLKPKNLNEFSAISGVGKVKLEKYGQQFLDVINE